LEGRNGQESMTGLPESFAGYPLSVGELRSDAENDAALWTPRDVLIDLLRRIDEKKIDPDVIVVIVRPRKKHDGSGTPQAKYMISSPDYHTSLGMVTDIKHRMMHDAEPN
jgi:hypothetical protein